MRRSISRHQSVVDGWTCWGRSTPRSSPACECCSRAPRMTRLARTSTPFRSSTRICWTSRRSPSDGDQPGDVVGPYRLLRELGSGGMGVVWLAERTDGLINRPVALKLPHGAWKRAGLAERMAREREILATLSHPNIAHLYDAGVTAGGQPYLAIEYVEGRRIDVYCREQHLDVEARLRLFAQVAGAVAYAHGKLAVHRDLKPANILVSAGGQVRLLDFGIAKLLDDGQAKEDRFTELSGRALTPDYASPEQIRGRTAHRRVGRLFARRGVVRAARRAAAVQAAARLTRRTRRRHPAGGPAAAERRGGARTSQRPARRSRHRGAQGAQEAALRAVPDGARPARRHRAPSQLAAGARAARQPVVPHEEVHRPQHARGGRRRRHRRRAGRRRRRRRLAGADRARGKGARRGSAGLHRVGVPRGRPDDAARGQGAVGGGSCCSRPNAA